VTYEIGNVLDVLPTIAAGRFRCCVTSPPYWGLRDYGHADQLGLEATPEMYVERMVAVFREVRRTLTDDGTLWLNVGDSYAMSTKGSSGKGDKQLSNVGTVIKDRSWSIPRGLKPKDLVGIPWMLAFALRADGWYLRSDIIWAKPNPMPESVTDRPTKAHEYVFLLSKSASYFYDAAAIAERALQPAGNPKLTAQHKRSVLQSVESSTLGTNQGSDTRNARTIWTIASQPFDGAHFATMPPTLAERCILAGSKIGDEVIDPFLGSGTTGMVAERNGRRWFGVELNPNYEPIIRQRTAQIGLLSIGAAP